MLKPEQVPEEAMNALLHALRLRKGGKEAIAAAVNAWPGMGRFEDETGWDVHIELPLLVTLSTEGVMAETDAEFVERMENEWVRDCIPNSDDAYRLFALARRGADAADEIERLRAALRPFADVARDWPDADPDVECGVGVMFVADGKAKIYFRDFHAARTALKEERT